MNLIERAFALDDIAIRAGGSGRTVIAYAAMFDQPYEVPENPDLRLPGRPYCGHRGRRASHDLQAIPRHKLAPFVRGSGSAVGGLALVAVRTRFPRTLFAHTTSFVGAAPRAAWGEM